MNAILQLSNKVHDLLDEIKRIDFLAPLAFRLYLAPILIAAGLHKYHNFEDIVSWFGNEDWGLGLPMPYLMAFLATLTSRKSRA